MQKSGQSMPDSKKTFRVSKLRLGRCWIRCQPESKPWLGPWPRWPNSHHTLWPTIWPKYDCKISILHLSKPWLQQSNNHSTLLSTPPSAWFIVFFKFSIVKTLRGVSTLISSVSSSTNYFQCGVMYRSDRIVGWQNRFYSIGGFGGVCLWGRMKMKKEEECVRLCIGRIGFWGDGTGFIQTNQLKPNNNTKQTNKQTDHPPIQNNPML